MWTNVDFNKNWGVFFKLAGSLLTCQENFTPFMELCDSLPRSQAAIR